MSSRQNQQSAERIASEEFRLGDSPWFWLALFGTVAIVGLLVVNQKYSARQMRLELRHQNRMEVQNRRDALATGRAPEDERQMAPIQAQEPRPRAGLLSLLVVFGTIALAGYAGLATKLITAVHFSAAERLIDGKQSE